MSVEIRDILRNRVKEKLARDEVVASMTVRLVRHIEIARMAASAGFDTLYVDVEHNGFSWDSGQYDDPRVRAAYARTTAACRKHGKHVGVGGVASRPDLTAEFVKLGARYVSTGTDLGFLMSTCLQKARQVRDIKT